MGVDFIQRQLSLVVSKSWKNQIAVENNNKYNIITLNTTNSKIWHVKENYKIIKLSKIYLTSIQSTIVMNNG